MSDFEKTLEGKISYKRKHFEENELKEKIQIKLDWYGSGERPHYPKNI